MFTFFILLEKLILRLQGLSQGMAGLRASPPAAGPLKVTGNRWLVIGGRFYRIGGCLDHLSASLLSLGDVLVGSEGPSDHMVSALAVRA